MVLSTSYCPRCGKDESHFMQPRPGVAGYFICEVAPSEPSWSLAAVMICAIGLLAAVAALLLVPFGGI